MEKIIVTDSVETRANFEGNDTELLLERVNNPIIKQQMIDLLYQSGQAYGVYIKTQKFKPFGNPELKLIEDEEGVIYPESELDYVPPSHEQVEEILDIWITNATASTEVSFSPDQQPHENMVSIHWCEPGKGKMNTKQLSIVEAHEKGHAIRLYSTDFFRHYFARGFDHSRITFSEKDFSVTKGLSPDEHMSFDEAKESFFRYLFSGPEIAERMSQLKNYFGLQGNELFTKEQLDYARVHYVVDTGLDNRMTPFLNAITPETEEAFLELINTSGI